MLGHLGWLTACYAAGVSPLTTLLQDLSTLSPTQKCALALYNQVRIRRTSVATFPPTSVLFKLWCCRSLRPWWALA